MEKFKVVTIMTPLVLIAWFGALAQVNYTEGFDGTTFPPTGWSSSILSGSINWQRVTSGTYPVNPPRTGAAMAQYDSWNTGSAGEQAMLVTPSINYAGRGSNTPTVSFWMYRHYYSTSGSNGPLDVYVNTSPTATGGTLLGSINPRYDLTPAVGSTGWYQYTYNIPASYNTATNYIIFKATSDYYNNIQVDDVAWVAYPSGPLPPTAFTVGLLSQSSIGLGWTKNAANNDVMIVYSTTGTFGTPVDGTSYVAGSSISGGGTVLYVGSGTSTTHTGVVAGTTYYYRIYSKTSTNTYSSSYASGSQAVPQAPPYTEGFEGITANNQFPTGWVYSADARSFTAPYGSYNANPRTGSKFAAFYYSPSGVGYMINGGLYLTGGIQYNAFAWYITDAYSGWNSLSIKWGATQVIGSMATVSGASIANPINTTYARLAGTFTPPSNGLYYIGIACDHNTVPYYLSIDDIAVNDFPQKDIAVTKAVLRYADSTWTRGAPRRHAVQAVVQNLGWETNPTSLQMSYSDGTTTVTETISPSWVGNTATVTFATLYRPTTVGNRTITVTSLYGDSPLTSNNSATFTVPVQAVTVVGYEDFNNFVVPGFNYNPSMTAEAFIVNNVNAGNTFLTSTGTGVSGSQAVEYPGDTQTANDWLITPPAYLSAGSSYRFRMQYASQAGLAQNFQLYYGTSTDPAGMQPLVNGTFTGANNTAFKETGTTGTYPYFNTTVAGNYYIGIKVTSAANSGKLIFDNMLLDINPAPPPKIGFRYESPSTAPYIDDPSTARIDLTAIYRSTGVINRRYQVSNTTNLYGSNGFMLWNVTTKTSWIRLAMDAALATPQTNPYSPAWPREKQYFNLIIDPSSLLPGTYNGSITFIGTLWNDDYPVSKPGLTASNQPFVVPVNLTIIQNGSGGVGNPNSVTGTNLAAGSTTVLTDGLGNKIAGIKVITGTIPSITVTEYPNQLPPGYTRMRWVRKYWTIAAPGTGWVADVTFFYTDTEVNAGGVVNRDNLRGWRHASPKPWEYAGTGSTSDPASNSVTILGLTPSTVTGDFGVATRWNHSAKSGSNSQELAFSLGANYPNPFNPSTKIDFSIDEEGPVTLVVFNNMGAEVARIVDEVMEAGNYTVSFDASNLPAGTYVYRLTSGASVETRRMTLIK
jgi:hypothetical protein